MPTNEWSISGCLKAWRGWTSSLPERLKAGLGTARAGEVCAAAVAAAVLCSLFSTFFCGFAEGFGDLYGETAATGRDVEKWRARSDKRSARFVACDESILFNVPQSKNLAREETGIELTPHFRGSASRGGFVWTDDSKIFMFNSLTFAKHSVWIAASEVGLPSFRHITEWGNADCIGLSPRSPPTFSILHATVTTKFVVDCILHVALKLHSPRHDVFPQLMLSH